MKPHSDSLPGPRPTEVGGPPGPHQISHETESRTWTSAHRRAAAYTLVELMVVLVILGLLIGLVAPNFFGRADKAHVDTANIQMKSFYGALQTYRLDIGRYPTTAQGLAALIEAPAEVADYWHGPYLDADAVPLDPWKTPYRYEQPADTRHGFALYSLGADGATGGEDFDADIGYLPEQRSAQAQ